MRSFGVIYPRCSSLGSGLCPEKLPKSYFRNTLAGFFFFFTKRLHYVKTISRLGCSKTFPTKKSLLEWSEYRNPCSAVRETFEDSRWGVPLMLLSTQLKEEQPREAQWCSHPGIQDQEHDKEEETAICRWQVWATGNSPNPGLILAKSNQIFYPKSPTDLEAQPILPKETSNWKFTLNLEVVDLTMALV